MHGVVYRFGLESLKKPAEGVVEWTPTAQLKRLRPGTTFLTSVFVKSLGAYLISRARGGRPGRVSAGAYRLRVLSHSWRHLKWRASVYIVLLCMVDIKLLR